MKVKCIKLLDARGVETKSSPWLRLGSVYHVMSIFVASDGKRSYSIVNHEPENEWPQMTSHPVECFEIVSVRVPSNWSVWIDNSSGIGISPTAWQDASFYQGFFDHEPATYPIFVRERDIVLKEDP